MPKGIKSGLGFWGGIRPTVRRLDTVSISMLIAMDGVNADLAGANICQSRARFRPWKMTKKRPWMRRLLIS